jgi:hypothetical protein
MRAPCRRARPKSRGNLKNQKYHIFTIAQLAKRHTAGEAGFILDSPRSTQKGKDRKVLRQRRYDIRRAFGIGCPTEKSVFRWYLPIRDGANPSPDAPRRPPWRIRTRTPIPKSAAVHPSPETGQERYRGSRLESLSGPNPGRLSRASHRPAHRDRPCG